MAAVLIRHLPLHGSATMRRYACGLGAASSLGDPPRDQFRVGPGLPAQPGRLPGQLNQLAFRGALEDPGHLGEQVGPAVGQRAELGDRDGFLLGGERAPPGAVPSLPGQLSH